MESLEMLANNLANTETGGYKVDREFYNLYVAPEAADASTFPTTVPLIEKPWTDFSQGMIRPTDNPFDLALSGKGFFAVQGPSGPLYTRNGNFRISPAGVLTAAEGYPVRTSGGGQLRLQAGKPVEVDAAGVVRQDGQVVGSLEIVDFPQSAPPAKQGNNYFRNPDPAAAPKAAAGVEVQQGKLESSNVGPAESAVRLVSVMRQFEMLQKALAVGADMNKKAVQDVARISS